MHMSIFISDIALSNSSWYDAFHVQVTLLDVSLHRGSHMSVVPGENFPRQLIIPKKACSSFLLFGASMSVSVLIFWGSEWTPSLNITIPKKGIDVHLKWHLTLFSFKLTSLHHLNTLWTAASWSALSSSYPWLKCCLWCQKCLACH